MDLTGRRVVVVGLGRSGVAAARLARAHGAVVVGVDSRASLPVATADALTVAGVDDVQLGEHVRATFTGADVLIVSPGVAAAQPDVAAAIAAGVDVVGELGFAARYVTAPIVAITGTNGKSTVTSFTGALLAADGRRVFTGGNLGLPFSEAARGPAPDVCVVEVSSYQLELPGTFSPHVGVVLNLTPDHLARHGTMDAYAATKLRLFERMGPGDIALLPPDDERLVRLASGVGNPWIGWLGGMPGVQRTGRSAMVALPGLMATLDLSGVTVPGAHNLDHAATAAALALAAGAPVDAVQAALPRLQALSHRMEPVADRDGVLWINDSKATNVASTEVGVAGLDRAAVVLLGGQAKGPGFDVLVPVLQRHRAVICFGGSGPDIADELTHAGLPVHRVASMADAITVARSLAQPGDAVLLSPGCASFDAFTDFEHRGRVFAALARGEQP